MTDSNFSPLPGSTCRAAISSHPVVLADGRSWGLARPNRRYRPQVVCSVDPFGQETCTIRLHVRTGYPRWIECLVLELKAATMAGNDVASDFRRFDALINLARVLLLQAHELTIEEANVLLDLDDIGFALLADAIVAIISDISADLVFNSTSSLV